MADVKITIDIDADTAAIDRLRAKLRALCREVDDCSDTHRKFTKDLEDLSGATDKNSDSDERNSKSKSKMIKFLDKLAKSIRSVAKFALKYLAIEAAAAFAVLALIGPLFKTGAFLAKAYQSALTGVSYALAAVVAGAAAFAAAQRQFQAVQFAPQFTEGAINTENRFTAASGAMKMFVDDAQMAVIGTKGLSAAFKTLNDQQAVTGKTTAVFRELSNYTAGMGGDMEKGSQAMAKFLAQFQKDKTMTDKVTEAGKELGPGFEKILKEARAKGLSSYDKFAEAAMKGELGKTFKQYAGQLDAVNSTVIGKFKQAFAGIKSTFVEMGEPLLGPITKEIPRIANIIEALLLRIRGNVQEIGSGSLLTGIVNMFDKVANIVGNLVTRDLSKVGNIVTSMKNGWAIMGRVFEKIQDYLRPLQDASWALWRILKPLLSAFAGNFNSTLQMLAQSLVDNESKFTDFTTSLGHMLKDVGTFGTAVKELIISLLPDLASFAETVGSTFVALAKMVRSAGPGVNLVIDFFQNILRGINLILNGIDYFFTGLSKIASVVDMIVNPILDVLKFITFGFIDINNIFQKTANLLKGIIATLILATVAFGVSAVKDTLGKSGGGLYRGAKKANNARKAWKAGRLAKGGGGAGGGAAGGGGAAAGGGAAIAGTAAVVAASGAGGYLTGGFLSDKLFNDDSLMSKSGGALVGAASGAAVGAAIGAALGSVVPLAGNLAGGAVGAVIGGIAGGVAGWVKAGREKKAARKQAKEILDNYNKGMDEAIKNGDLDALVKSRTEAMNQFADLKGKNKYGAKEVERRRKEIEKLNKQVDTYIKNAGNFKMFFGGDADKMNEALTNAGLKTDDAKNAIINIFEIMRKGGVDVSAKWKEVMGGFNQSLLEARLNMFNEQKDTTLEMQKAVDAAQRKILEGDTSEKSVTEFLKKAYEYSLSQTGGDAVAATALLKEQLTYAYGPGGALTDVADKISKTADSLRLFDPKLLVDQMIQSGKLQAQARAVETLSGGRVTANQAELQIQRLIANAGPDGAAMATKINTLMDFGVSGAVTPEALMGMLFQDGANVGTAMDAFIANVSKNEDLRRRYANAYGPGTRGTAGSNAVPNFGVTPIDIGGVTVQVSGLIKDEGTAKMIAQEVQKAIAKYGERRGSGTVTTGTNGSGQTDTAPDQGTGTRPLNP